MQLLQHNGSVDTPGPTWHWRITWHLRSQSAANSSAPLRSVPGACRPPARTILASSRTSAVGNATVTWCKEMTGSSLCDVGTTVLVPMTTFHSHPLEGHHGHPFKFKLFIGLFFVVYSTALNGHCRDASCDVCCDPGSFCIKVNGALLLSCAIWQ